jgi:hypothetical protein
VREALERPGSVGIAERITAVYEKPAVGRCASQCGTRQGKSRIGGNESYRLTRTCSKVLRLCDVVGLLCGVFAIEMPVPGLGGQVAADGGAVIHGIFAPLVSMDSSTNGTHASDWSDQSLIDELWHVIGREPYGLGFASTKSRIIP